MAHVLNLFRAPQKLFFRVREVADSGFEGCAHARPGRSRQVLLFDSETLDAMDLQPGIIRENITIHGLNVSSLGQGQQLRIGEIRLEVREVCTPCNQMDEIRPGLQKELKGRRGMLSRVIEGGIIRRGDPIEEIS